MAGSTTNMTGPGMKAWRQGLRDEGRYGDYKAACEAWRAEHGGTHFAAEIAVRPQFGWEGEARATELKAVERLNKGKQDALAADKARRAAMEAFRPRGDVGAELEWVVTHPAHIGTGKAKLTVADLDGCPSRLAAVMLEKAASSPTDFKGYFEQLLKLILAEKKKKPGEEEAKDADPGLADLERMLAEAMK